MTTPARVEPLSGDLASLVQTEERLEQELARARAQAAGIVSAAEAAARESDLALEHELVELARSIEARAKAERSARISRVEAEADAALAVFREQDPERVRVLARYVAELVARGEGGTP